TELQRKITAGELKPDFGPPDLHPTAGAVLVAARPPLVAFNVELEPPATLETAKHIAAHIRESGDEGLPGLRAIGLWLAQRNPARVPPQRGGPRAHPRGPRGWGRGPPRPCPRSGAGRSRARGRVRPIPAADPAPWIRDDRGNPSPPRPHRVKSLSPMAQTK